MRTFRAKSGPFSEQVFYEDSEIEKICEDALEQSGYYPNTPEPVRIERFIEKRFRVCPQFEELPLGVLGYSCFGISGLVSMHISSALVDSNIPSDERRASSTLAHETGHGLLHAHLFPLVNPGPELLSGTHDVTPTKILCREPGAGDGRRSYDGRWWEVQANKSIGPLLMPRALVAKALEPFLLPQGMLGLPEINPNRREEAARAMAEVFEVNPAVARIRLNGLYPAKGGQLTL